MKKGQLIESRFRGVYLGIALIWISMSLALSLGVDAFVYPQIIHHRIAEAEGLIRSHQEDLTYSNNRSLRDELLKNGILTDDRSFEQLWIKGDSEKIGALLKSCRFITDTTCIGDNLALVFNVPARTSLGASSYAVELDTDYFMRIADLLFWKLIGSGALLFVLSLVVYGIRRQELFLIRKVGLLLESQNQIENLFKIENTEPVGRIDEFALISKSFDRAGSVIRDHTAKIERYKKEFEKKTQIEQLAKTIGYTSHNLTAPFLEGMDFFHNFPRYLESMPREKLLLMGESLEQRFKEGSNSLKKALSQTRESYRQPEHVALSGLLQGFSKDVKRSPHYGSANISLNIDDRGKKAKVFCSTQEMDAALWNLLLNALDAKSDAEIQIQAFTDDSHAVVRFQDNGPGIPEFQREQVFEDFFTTKSFGTGLGLGSVKETVKKYGGTIEILPTRVGAHFEMRLPLSEVGHA